MKMTFYRTLLCVCMASGFMLLACSKSDSGSSSPTPPKDTVALPAVSSLFPSKGKANSSVSIYGTGFSDTLTHDSVFFNGVKAELTSASKTLLMANVPLGAGTGKITVYVNGTPVTGPVFTYDSTYAVSVLAGNGKSGFSDGIGANASFRGPTDAVTDASGNIYITDSYNKAIRKITPNGVVTTLAGGLGAGSDDGTGIGPFFNELTGIAIDAAGTLYVCDAGNNKVRKVTQAGVVTTLAGGSYGDVDGIGTAARFGWLQGIGVDKNGNVYVADAGNSKVKKITPAGVVTTLAGNSTPGGKDGPGASASFCLLAGLAVDDNGNVYVAEGKFTLSAAAGTFQGNNKIRKITPDGTVSTFAGSGAVGGASGTATNASFDNPNGLRFDSNGNLYVTETWGQRIRKITPAAVVTIFAGTGFAGATNGTLDVATFYSPSGIGIDNKGNFYVADFSNALIRKISLQ